MRTALCVMAIGFGLNAPAFAQRTDDNATRSASDAFGKSVGDEQIGIYNPSDVRGFSAIDAGNVRLEGLYFDLQAGPNDRLVDGSTLHVGISTQGFAFPAPTGVADYSLRKPGARPLASIVLQTGPFGTKDAELDLQMPFDGEKLGVSAGASIKSEHRTFGSAVLSTSVSIAPIWRPADGVEVIPFWSFTRSSGDEAQTLVFSAGDFLPPRVPRGRFIGQPWAQSRGKGWNTGLIVKTPVAGFDIALGLYRSVERDAQRATDLLLDVQQNFTAGDRLIIIDRDNRFASSSGELRISRQFDEGHRRHIFTLVARARDGSRTYGGSDVISLGPTVYGEQDFRPKPAFTFGPKTHDAVKQATAGLAYQLHWLNVGELGLGVQKTRYSKRVVEPDPIGALPTSSSSPWLVYGTAAINLRRRFAVYAGYTRGLEESPVASDLAVNRNEAPPAIRTEQADAGLRWTITDKLSGIVGVFEITKPYFNLDQNLLFRQLGKLRNRGIEMSLAGQISPQLNIVAGTLLLDPEVLGEEVRAGLIGRRPVGAIKRHSIVSVDYRIPNSGFSVDAIVEETGDRIASSGSHLVVPPRAVLSLGARFRFNLNKTPILIRGQLANVFNKYGYGVGTSGYFVYNGQRRLMVTLAADI